MTALATLLVVLIASASTGSAQGLSAEAGGPLVGVPVGWLHVSRRGTDSWLGAYVDSQSGAVVTYAVGGMAGRYVNAYPDVERESGSNADGTQYLLVRDPHVRTRAIERLEREVGPSFANDPAWDSLVPPEGSTGFVVTLVPGAIPYNFTAWVCDPTEERRFHDLLTHTRLTQETVEPVRETPAATCEAAAKQDLGSVLRAWGTPSAVFRPRCGRLALDFGFAGGGICRLEFDRSLRLMTAGTPR